MFTIYDTAVALTYSTIVPQSRSTTMSTPTTPHALIAEVDAILIDRGFGPSSPAASRIWYSAIQVQPAVTIAEVARAGSTLAWLYDSAESYIAEGWPEGRRTAQRFVNQFAG